MPSNKEGDEFTTQCSDGFTVNAIPKPVFTAKQKSGGVRNERTTNQTNRKISR